MSSTRARATCLPRTVASDFVLVRLPRNAIRAREVGAHLGAIIVLHDESAGPCCCCHGKCGLSLAVSKADCGPRWVLWGLGVRGRDSRVVADADATLPLSWREYASLGPVSALV